MALAPWGPAPSDIQNISTPSGVGSHPFPRAGATPSTRAGLAKTGPRPLPWRPPLRINLCLFTYQPRTGSTGGPGRRASTTAGCGTLVCSRLYDPGQKYGGTHGGKHSGKQRREARRKQAPTPVGGADGGNQPIYRRVDTISKQYRVSRTQHDGNDGGGAPWES
ncbi:hypothetical protein GCM10010510_44000 [Streptomyces anandii JCM 4720]|nr:hypothetical protein GCM10010510_44000 [Streptomyces anandii JCM 4720]